MNQPLTLTEENRFLRVKIMSACNLSCHFCHNEGSHSLFRAMQPMQFHKVLDFAQRNGFSEIHFTGGEPTLNKHLPEFVRRAKALRMQTGVTTNAQFIQPDIPLQLSDVGIDKVNVSLHSIRPEGWAAVQRTSLETAKAQLTSTLRGIESCQKAGLRLKANVVVEDAEVSLEVMSYLAANNVPIRLLDLLGSSMSLKIIERILLELDASPIKTVDVLGTSQRKRMYTSRLGEISVKEVRDFSIASICTGGDECFEKFYGIRIESQGAMLFARLCLCGETPTTLIQLKEFENSPQLHDILFLGRNR